MKSKPNQHARNLIRRYLVWCYKTTQESLDRIDRKFTQLEVDQFIFEQIKNSKELFNPEANRRYKNLINNFKLYMNNKKEEAKKQKYFEDDSATLNPDYLYHRDRLEAVKKAIRYFLSPADLEKIKKSYEEEMTRRIWEAKEHT